uniref:Uncharacterized protein n=1 Tax=Panagrolaimus sp. ES5 TaxID=591445 RepID=A0AC34EZ57_9BILA
MASTSRARVAPPIQPFSKGAQNRRVMSLKPRRTLPYQQANRAGLPTSTLLAASAATKSSSATSKGSSINSASIEENDSDSGRPRSTDFEEATEESDDDDYPDVHMDVLSENDSLESPPNSRASNASRSPPDTAAQTPGSTRPPSAISQAVVIPADGDKRRNEAATTIQKHIRGHLTRKRVKPLLEAAAVGRVTEEHMIASESESEPEEEDEPDSQEDIPNNDGRRNAAAVTIQKHIRGHLTRKRVKPRLQRSATPGAAMLVDGDDEEEETGENKIEQHFHDDDYSEAEQSEHSDSSHSGRLESESEAEQSEYDDLPDDEVDENIERKHEAATVIQKNWKGFYVRKNLDKIVPTRMHLPSEEEGFEESFENEDEEIRLETAAPAGEPGEVINSETGFTYTAAIFTGNRWAADTESDLYIILYGDKGESEKHFLRQDSKEKGAQAFRELVIFRGSSDTLPLYTYEGKMRIIPSQISLCSPSIKLEICGENGESGIFPASIANTEGKKDKFDVSFRVEAVSVGRVLAMRIYFDPTLEGEIIFEGLAEMQKLLDKTGLDTSLGTDFLISYIIVRESHHAP